ncbi:nucleoside hydrolase [Marinococcus halophilus]|uniref:Inosine-uridine nucleoside N-ribohydrolase n=1 Tax=Marinococcus halophilus TaxID=1371 RepID=A0A510YB85_MARHA|nr:nucleoside hydrolase [Marinococcus halophilus]OZT79104.1 nucleoside hydrolase [Marinococcus halophilus]GEK59911.1 inosine-uridine nucleoside N-ribohydrolase [Marinococcus halophilus]
MKNIILDVDTGIDDALAIAYAIHSPELNILGITTSFGNTTVSEATKNTLQLLDTIGVKIPVIPGVSKKFNGEDPREKTVTIHGNNGIGEATLSPAVSKPHEMLAHDFIISAIHQHQNDITILTTASQVNLAEAVKKDPNIIPLVDEVLVMGGAISVPGNITPYAEANIYTDTEAAQFTFSSGLPITLVGLDVTTKTLLKRDVLKKWKKKNSSLAHVLAEACEFYMDAYARVEPELNGCALHDPLTVGIAIDSSFVQTAPMHVDVLTEGSKAGQTLGKKASKNTNINVCLDVESNRFVTHFLNRIV